MANTVKPVGFAIEKWMRMHLPPNNDLFVFSGYADFTGGPEPLQGTGDANTDGQATWVEYDIEGIIVGPHWRGLQGVSPSVVIGGYSQVSPDVANAMGFRVQGITFIGLVSVPNTAFSRIELHVGVLVRGGLDGKVLSLAYQATAWGNLATPLSSTPPEGTFWPGTPGDTT